MIMNPHGENKNKRGKLLMSIKIWVRNQDRQAFFLVDSLWIESFYDAETEKKANLARSSAMNNSYSFGSTMNAEIEAGARVKKVYVESKPLYSLNCTNGLLGTFKSLEQPMKILDKFQEAINLGDCFIG